MPSDNARASDRRRQLKTGTICSQGRHITQPCIVRDISDHGARLKVETAHLPDTFELLIDLDGLEADCSVIWRHGDYVGVRFERPPRRVPPRRAQSVDAVRPLKLSTLRRQRPTR